MVLGIIRGPPALYYKIMSTSQYRIWTVSFHISELQDIYMRFRVEEEVKTRSG